jgi:signal transduction histidine kinase
MSPGAGALDDHAPTRALAALLPCGVLLLDADGALRFASARACAMLGEAEEPRLVARWPSLAPALGVAAGSLPRGAQPLRAGGAVDGGDGALRIEVHATGATNGAAYLALLQRSDRLESPDWSLIAASRADAHQYVLAGLLHDLNGPLNNFNLTLALLSGTLARITAQQPDDPALERCRRYADTLTNETRRFSECARAMTAAVTPAEPSTGVLSISALLHGAQHALRHHASLREVRMRLDATDAEACAAGDTDLLHLALIDLMLAAIDATAAGGEIAVTPEPRDGTLSIRIVARPARVSADALRGTEDVLAFPGPQSLGFVAARRIIERHGGVATMRTDAGDALVVDARMPLHRA